MFDYFISYSWRDAQWVKWLEWHVQTLNIRVVSACIHVGSSNRSPALEQQAVDAYSIDGTTVHHHQDINFQTQLESLVGEAPKLLHLICQIGADNHNQRGVVATERSGSKKILSFNEMGRLMKGAQGLRIVILDIESLVPSDYTGIVRDVLTPLVNSGLFGAAVIDRSALLDEDLWSYYCRLSLDLANGLPPDDSLEDANKQLSRENPDLSHWRLPKLFLTTNRRASTRGKQTDNTSNKNRLGVANKDQPGYENHE